MEEYDMGSNLCEDEETSVNNDVNENCTIEIEVGHDDVPLPDSDENYNNLAVSENGEESGDPCYSGVNAALPAGLDVQRSGKRPFGDIDEPDSPARQFAEPQSPLGYHNPSSSDSSNENNREIDESQSPSDYIDSSSSESLDDDADGHVSQSFFQRFNSFYMNRARSLSGGVSTGTRWPLILPPESSNHSDNYDYLKLKPEKCDFHILKALAVRELGHKPRRGGGGRSTTGGEFGASFTSSLTAVEQMDVSHKLLGHRSCVYSLSFNRQGNLLCTGSDDRSIKIWNWAKGKLELDIVNENISRVIQAKLIDDGRNALKIVSCYSDSQVQLIHLAESGSYKMACLYKDSKPVQSLALDPFSTDLIYSAGLSGNVLQYDLRSDHFNTVTKVQSRCCRIRNSVPLRMVSHHPYAPEFCVSGDDPYVYIYDKRNALKPLRTFRWMMDSEFSFVATAYNFDGSEILASYSEGTIFLFDNKTTDTDSQSYIHLYRGHGNVSNISEVSFFGPKSEYILSGGDHGHVFYWQKSTGAIVNYTKCFGRQQSVNCLEVHPSFPILATSGMSKAVALHMPLGKKKDNFDSDLDSLIRRYTLTSLLDLSLESNDSDYDAYNVYRDEDSYNSGSSDYY